MIQIPQDPPPHFESQWPVFPSSQGPVRSRSSLGVFRDSCSELKKKKQYCFLFLKTDIKWLQSRNHLGTCLSLNMSNKIDNSCPSPVPEQMIIAGEEAGQMKIPGENAGPSYTILFPPIGHPYIRIHSTSLTDTGKERSLLKL